MQTTCQLDPMGSGIHSNDLVTVYHGTTEPAIVCGYHATYWPELVARDDPFRDHPMWCKCYFHR